MERENDGWNINFQKFVLTFGGSIIRAKLDDLESDHLKDAAEEFLDGFCTPAFSALSKSEIELLVLRFLSRSHRPRLEREKILQSLLDRLKAIY